MKKTWLFSKMSLGLVLILVALVGFGVFLLKKTPSTECGSFGDPILITPVFVKDEKFIMPHFDFTLKECESAKIANTGILIEYLGQKTAPGFEGGMTAYYTITENGEPYEINQGPYVIWNSGYNKKMGATFTISERESQF